MATEIERKFRVTGEFPEGESTEIQQAYLCLDPERTIRVRIDGDIATINLKGKTRGLSRKEFEFEIPMDDAREMFDLSIGAPIRKTRTRIPIGNHVWEIDVFHDSNDGLVIAEIEMESETEQVELPEWVGEEVSHDPRYLNACLVRNPFTEWILEA
jgi:CYTH domain-containing protein